MASWIHCNNCGRLYSEKTSFYVGACGHLECNYCLKPDSNQNCSICQKPCKRILLSKNMQPDILMFFKSPSPLMDQIKKVVEFQEKQHNNLINLLQLKYSNMKKDTLKYQKIIESQRNDINKLKNLCKSYQAQASPGRNLHLTLSSGRANTSTPMSKSFNNLDCTISTIPSSLKPGYARRVPTGVQGRQNLFMTPKTSTPTGRAVPASASSTASANFSENQSVTMFPPLNFPYIRRYRQN
ncbi:zip homologous protein 2 [Onthophagus taurus]|uniref:zip homologous protein 2 n=1 Tax=Onthophagus taurus TaxID=166361 RepID=UPI000C1FFED9|nr:probable E3 SUMO-protein ligase RNF212 [Onthophagus taurus]